MINDILDMSQIEQSKLHMNVQVIHIDELLDQISSIMASPSKDAGLKFMVERGEIQHLYFQGDALRIKQILINILSNAFNSPWKAETFGSGRRKYRHMKAEE